MKEDSVNIIGMSCASCAARIEKGLGKMDGVDTVAVNLAMERASIKYDESLIDEENIKQKIKELGYGVIEEEKPDMIKAVNESGYKAEEVKRTSRDREKEARDKEAKKLKFRLQMSALFSFPLLLAMFTSISGIPIEFLHNPLFQLIAATPVQFIIGLKFYINSYHSLRAKSPGMDLLVAMGTSAAYFFSIYNGFIKDIPIGGRPDLYFEASAIIITLILLGKYLEAAAKGRTSEAIKKLCC